MVIEDPNEMDTAEMVEPNTQTNSPIPDNVTSPLTNNNKTFFGELSDVSETSLDEHILEKITNTVNVKSDEWGHLTSHCCLPQENVNEISSSRSSSDSGVMMGNRTEPKNDQKTRDSTSSDTEDTQVLNESLVALACDKTIKGGINAHDNSLSHAETTLHTHQNNSEEKLSHPVAVQSDLMDALKIPEDFPPSEINECRKIELPEETTRKLVGCPVLENVIGTRPPVDTVICCSGGKIGAHRVVLAAASPFMETLFQEQKLGEVATLILPDMSVKVMEILLQLCYSGEMVFPKALESEIYEAMECLMIGISGELSLKEVTVKIRPPPPISIPTQPLKENIHMVPDQLAVEPAGPSTIVEAVKSDDDESENNCNSQAKSSAPSSSVPSTSRYRPPPVIASATLIQEGKLKCCLCNTVWASRTSFIRHLEKSHHRKFVCSNISASELNTLSYCNICDKHHESVIMAGKCDKTHKLARCWSCLGIYPVDNLINHYRVAHGLKTEDGITVKCRWCDISLRVTNIHGMNGLTKHSMTHLDLQVPYEPKFVNGKRSQQLITSTTKRRTSTTPSVIPFLKQFTNNLEAELVSKPHSSSKKRKLDESGKPLQLARRTGIPIGKGKKRKTLSPSIHYNRGTFSITTNTTDGKVSRDTISQLPEIAVHLDLLSEMEIDMYVNREYCKERTPVEKSNDTNMALEESKQETLMSPMTDTLIEDKQAETIADDRYKISPETTKVEESKYDEKMDDGADGVSDDHDEMEKDGVELSLDLELCSHTGPDNFNLLLDTLEQPIPINVSTAVIQIQAEATEAAVGDTSDQVSINESEPSTQLLIEDNTELCNNNPFSSVVLPEDYCNMDTQEVSIPIENRNTVQDIDLFGTESGSAFDRKTFSEMTESNLQFLEQMEKDVAAKTVCFYDMVPSGLPTNGC